MRNINWRSTKVLVVIALLIGIGLGSLASAGKVYTQAQLNNAVQKAVADEDNKASSQQLQVKPETQASTPEPTKPLTTFGDGVYEVGVDIAPGVYKTAGPTGDNCYNARLSGFDTVRDIISNNNSSGPVTVEILSTDKAFKSSGCQSWKLVQ